MPHHKAQIKSLRQDKVRQVRNKSLRSRVMTLSKRAIAVAETGDEAAANDALKRAQSAIDKAAKRNAIHEKTADRRKATVAKRVQEALKAKAGS